MAIRLWTNALTNRARVRHIAAVGSACCLLFGFAIPSHVAAIGFEDCAVFGFSTEEDFVTQGPVPPDGNPIISDGDLFSADCAICARNADLLIGFEVGANLDLGLDAVDVITDGQDLAVAFSTELDSPTPGQFTAGDLLVTNGAVIPNVALTQLFPVSHDIGLDGLHFIGDPESILAFLDQAALVERANWITNPELLIELLNEYGVDIWFSTEGTAQSPSSPAFLDGDVLSVYQGIVVAGNDQLLPASTPAGIPTRGVDFGLDALSGDRQGTLAGLLLSTEIDSSDGTAFGDQDLIGYQASFVTSGAVIVQCFEPKNADLGLDALVPEPSRLLMLLAGTACLLLLARRRTAAG